MDDKAEDSQDFSDSQFDSEEIHQSHERNKMFRFLARNLWRRLLIVATVATGMLLLWVGATILKDYLSWANAEEVVGKVVDVKMEGSFMEDVVVEYITPDGKVSNARIPPQYTNEREIGREVVLVYRKTNPLVAMTRLQSRDNFSSLPLSWLAYLIPVFGLELIWIFPRFSRYRTT